MLPKNSPRNFLNLFLLAALVGLFFLTMNSSIADLKD
jgi:hypothetical protein